MALPNKDDSAIRQQQVQAWLATGDDEFVLLGGPQTDEWSCFRGAHPHALLIGSEAWATASMERLRPYLRAPLIIVALPERDRVSQRVTCCGQR